MGYASDINWRKSYGPQPRFSIGTPGVGVTADHFTVDGYHILTRLTLDAVFPAIAGGAALGVGLQVYTFPAGVHRLLSERIKIALTALDGNIDDDTPELSLGDTIVSGAVATMTTPAWENLLTAQVAVCDGTVEDKTLLQVTAAHLVNEAAGDKDVFLNVADTWATSGEAALPITGEIWLEWVRMTSAEE
jgi:hypothetical protein